MKARMAKVAYGGGGIMQKLKRRYLTLTWDLPCYGLACLPGNKRYRSRTGWW
ncbi:hypothetical protein KCP74_02460 [Salmonella enterica subsp. enterica]|nr:hypothetical protein KCP74_02460 [Salmonella enterica subsp. enterica]